MIILLIILGLYILMLMVMLYNYLAVQQSEPSKQAVSSFTILIPFRNEASNLSVLTASLRALEYPSSKYEILFLDDHSVDNGTEVIQENMGISQNVRILRLENTQGKKEAIKHGICHARHEIIITTDADCRVPEKWLQYFDRAYQEGADMCLGTVKLKGAGVWLDLQQFEQMAVTGIGAAMAQLGYPVMCNGANLSYRRRSFEHVGGFEDNLSIPSGDDQFLLQKIRRSGAKINFIESRQHVVETCAQKDWSGLVNQRLRWAGKWRATGGWLAVLSVLIGLAAFAVVLAWVGVIFAPQWINWLLPLTLFKVICEFLFVGVISWRQQIPVSWWTYPLFALFYPIYAVYISLRSNIGQYEWKGRRYSTG